MKVEIESLDGHNKKLVIEIPIERVNAEFDSYYKSVQRQVELKGFRKGKAPIDLVKKLYSDSAQGRVAQELVDTSLREALREHSLSPVGMPQVNVESLKEHNTFKYTATFEALPPIEPKDYMALQLKREAVIVSADEVEKTLENIASQMAELKEAPEGATVEAKSIVSIDYTGFEAGAEVKEASDKDGTFEVGAGALTPDFEKNLLGMTVGQKKSFTVKFPMPEKPEEKTPVSGRTIDFEVELKKLRSKQTPNIDDAFAAKLGPFESLANLRSRIEDDLKKQKESNQSRDLQEQAIDALLQKNVIEAPQTLVNAQLEQLAIDAGMQLSKMGLDEAAIEERLKGWGDDMMGRASRQIKVSLLLSAISKKENIQATDEDLRQEITRIAAETRRNPKDVLEDLQKRGLITGLVRQVTELKTLDWIVQKATA
jgi:trigger factor